MSDKKVQVIRMLLINVWIGTISGANGRDGKRFEQFTSDKMTDLNMLNIAEIIWNQRILENSSAIFFRSRPNENVWFHFIQYLLLF